MKEIKFRFHDKRTNEVGFSNSYNVAGDGAVLFLDGHDVSEYITALQYTGLKDKNGKEIYEGDVITVRGKKETVEMPNIYELIWTGEIKNVEIL